MSLNSLRKYGTLESSIENFQIRKIHPVTLINNLKIDIPKIQRIVNETKVSELVDIIINKQSILNENRILFGLLGDTYYLIDGQHRLLSIQYIINNIPTFIFRNHIWITIKLCNTMEDIYETYKNVNKNSPLDDFHNNLIKLNSNEHIIYNDFLKYMTDNYKKYISPQDTEPRIPNINITKIVKRMMESYSQTGESLLQRLNIMNSEQFINHIELINQKVRDTYIQQYNKINSKNRLNETDKKFLKYKEQITLKSKNGKELYLGLHLDWYELFNNINSTLIFPEYQLFDKKLVSETIWNLHSPNSNDAKCFCCDEVDINKNSYIMGHILARRYGGLITENNIKPVCFNCNLSMGTYNMYEYKAKLQKNSPNNTTIISNNENIETINNINQNIIL